MNGVRGIDQAAVIQYMVEGVTVKVTFVDPTTRKRRSVVGRVILRDGDDFTIDAGRGYSHSRFGFVSVRPVS